MRGIGSLAAALVAASAAGPAGAEERRVGRETTLPIPRYVSLRSDEINVRRGPGLDYRIDWVFRRAGLPVRIVDEFGDWRRVVDSDEAGGWVFHALLTGRRTALVTAPGVVLMPEPGSAGAERPCEGPAPLPPRAVACAEQGVVARLETCGPAWCRIERDGHAGWVPKAAIWGVGRDEVFDD